MGERFSCVRAVLFSVAIFNAGCTDSILVRPAPESTPVSDQARKEPVSRPLVWEFRPIANVVRDQEETKTDGIIFVLSSTPEAQPRGYRRISVDFPEEVKQRLEDKIVFLNNLLSEKDRIVGVELFEADKNSRLKVRGNPGPIESPRVIVDLKADTPVEVLEIERVAFHEGVHRVLWQSEKYRNSFGWADEKAAELWEKLNNTRAFLRRIELAEMRKANIDVMPYVTDLIDGIIPLDKDPFNVICESGYVMGGGHPWDNPAEMLTSTITVMHSYLKSFMMSVEAMDSENQKLILEVARHAVDILLGISVSKRAVYDLFSPRLLDYLGYNDRWL